MNAATDCNDEASSSRSNSDDNTIHDNDTVLNSTDETTGYNVSKEVVSNDDSISSEEQNPSPPTSKSNPISLPQEYEEILHQRDSARYETKVMNETLHSIMEAVQILTRQMKKSHYERLNSHNCTQSSSYIPYVASDLSVDTSVNMSLAETESIERNNENNNNENEEYENNNIGDILNDTDCTPPHGNRSRQRPPSKYFSAAGSTTSSVASYTNDDNQRFSELLHLSSSVSMEAYPNLSQIRSDLIALFHSCQMVGENAFWLHNEASTFLTDLQDVHMKLQEMENKCLKTERLAKRLYKENKALKADIENGKTQRKVLVKELKTLMYEKEMKLSFEDALTAHERIMTEQRSEQTKASASTVDIMQGDANVHSSSCDSIKRIKSSSTFSTTMSFQANFCEEYGDSSTTSTIIDQNSNHEGGEDNLFSTVVNNNSFAEGSKFSHHTKRNEKIISTPRSLSSFPQALQLTPTSSSMEYIKPTLSAMDLSENEESSSDQKLSPKLSSFVPEFKNFFLKAMPKPDSPKQAKTAVIKVKLPKQQQQQSHQHQQSQQSQQSQQQQQQIFIEKLNSEDSSATNSIKIQNSLCDETDVMYEHASEDDINNITKQNSEDTYTNIMKQNSEDTYNIMKQTSEDTTTTTNIMKQNSEDNSLRLMSSPSNVSQLSTASSTASVTSLPAPKKILNTKKKKQYRQYKLA